LDNDPTGKTFNIPLYRTAVANITMPPNTNNFRAYDLEGGATTEFTEFFGNDFLFDNYKALMQAKNAIDPLSGIIEDAVLYRSVEWGTSGEKFKVGYFYPTNANLGISHIATVDEDVDFKIFLKSGPSRTTTIDGTTEWDITIIPLNPSVDLVTYTHSGTGTVPGLASLNTGDYVSILNTGEFDPANQGAYRLDSSTASSFTIRRANGEALVQTDVATLETNAISFFESSDTTAQEIVDYVTTNLSDYLTAEVLADGGTTGAGIISQSTSEDSDFAYDYVSLLDGKNYIYTTDLDAAALSAQFVFKEALSLPTFSTNTVDAYAFNKGENVRLVPITSPHVTDFLNILAVTGYTTLGEIKSVDRNTDVQFSTDIIGSNGAVQISGGSASFANASVDGSASFIGEQSNASAIITVVASATRGFHSDQWVKVEASEIQKKNILINNLNRYHTRTRGRTFKVEKHGELTCISWDNVGTEPYFLKTAIDLKDTSASTLTIAKVFGSADVDVRVDTGDMRFDGVNIGDLVTFINRLNDVNNGSFLVIGKSNDGRTLRIINPDAIDELATGGFTITDNVAVLTSSFTVGASTLVEGTDFVAGATIDDTASNLSAAIALLPNLESSSIAGVVTVTSQVPAVVVATSVTGGGATAFDTQLNAPTSSTGDVSAVSEVSEGDTLSVNSDFDVLNQGMFRVIRRFKNSLYIDNQNSVEQEVTLAAQLVSTGADGSTDYDVEKLDGVTRLKWAGAGAQPTLEDVRPGDVITLGTDFSASNQGEFSVVGSGIDGVNYVDFINVNGANESGITIADVLEFHREAIKFKEYEGSVPGDKFVVADNFLGDENTGTFIIQEVLSETEAIVAGNMVNTGVVLLDTNANKIYVEEESPYVGYKKISLVATNPANLDSKNIVFDTYNQFEKIGEIGGVTLGAVGKLTFPTDLTTGIDSYQYNTGLIGESNRIVYGEPRDSTTYPGVAAAGAEIFIKAPLVRRIEVSIDIRVKTGVPFSVIVEEVRNSIASLINSNGVGQSIPISNIISNVDAIVGVYAVAISSPQYDPQNDVIRVNAREKSLVLDVVSDIIVSKID
jgi:hypothetical protein